MAMRKAAPVHSSDSACAAFGLPSRSGSKSGRTAFVIVRGGRPAGRVITAPPEVAVEVLSPEDRAADVQDRIDDYLRFGVPAVWLIDPERKRAWIHTPEGACEALDRVLRNAAGDLEVPLSAVFPENE